MKPLTKLLIILSLIMFSHIANAKDERIFNFENTRLGLKLPTNVKIPKSTGRYIHFENQNVRIMAHEYIKKKSIDNVFKELIERSSSNNIETKLIAPVFHEEFYGLLIKQTYKKEKKVLYQRIFGDYESVASFILECREKAIKHCESKYLSLLRETHWDRPSFKYLHKYFELSKELPAQFKLYDRVKNVFIFTELGVPTNLDKSSMFIFTICNSCNAQSEHLVLVKKLGLITKEVLHNPDPLKKYSSIYVTAQKSSAQLTCRVKSHKKTLISACYYRLKSKANYSELFEKIF